MNKTILIIEDDAHIADLIKIYCEQEGYRAIISDNGKEGAQMAQRIQPEAIILDRMLPEMEGLEILKQIRQKHQTPILLVTAKADEVEKIIGLELGADDYIAKPFSPKELMARLKAVLRRSQNKTPQQKIHIRHLDLELDGEKRMLTKNKKSIELSPLEFKLLTTLMQFPGRVFSRNELLEKVYESEHTTVFDRTIDAHVKNLRKKLEDDRKKPRYIESIFGVGYKLNES